MQKCVIKKRIENLGDLEQIEFSREYLFLGEMC